MESFAYHLDRIVEILSMASEVVVDESMPSLERAEELRRLARRLDSHANHLEAAAEMEGAR